MANELPTALPLLFAAKPEAGHEEHAHHAHEPIDHVLDEAAEWRIMGEIKLDMPYLGTSPNIGFAPGHEIYITKFMVLEVLAALLVIGIFVPLAQRARNGALPKGSWWNAFESLLTFVRDEIAKPNLGAREADKFVPFLWTLFLFILFMNLLGFIPLLGTPTASIWVTGGLALISFAALHGCAIWKMGHTAPHAHEHGHGHGHGTHAEHAVAPAHRHGGHGDGDHGHGGHGSPHAHGAESVSAPHPSIFEVAILGTSRYLKSMWPHIEIEIPVIGAAFAFVLSLGIFFIEFMGTFIKSGVLAVRLFANMFAGHMVSATILTFIVTAGNLVVSQVPSERIGPGLWVLVTAMSLTAVTALSLLELFVAFLQAFVFTFLTALFMGMAMNPEH